MLFCSIHHWVKISKLICNVICAALIVSYERVGGFYFVQMSPFQKSYMVVSCTFTILSTLALLYYYCLVFDAKISMSRLRTIHILFNGATAILFIVIGIGLFVETCKNDMCGSELQEKEEYYPDIAQLTKLLIACGAMALIDSLFYFLDAFIVSRTEVEKYTAVRVTYKK